MPAKVWGLAHLVKAMVFPVVIYGELDHKEAEHRRTDAFQLWCWRRLLRVPWTARRLNKPILKESTLNILWKDWCRSLSSNTLATWCEELTHWKRPWRWERLKAKGKEGGRWWDSITDSMGMNLSKLWETVKDRGAWYVAVHGDTESRRELSDWTTATNW